MSPATPTKLLDKVRRKIRFKHYSIRTEEAYTSWIKRYICVSRKKTPGGDGKAGDRILFDLSCHPTNGGRLHTEPGFQCVAFFSTKRSLKSR